MRYLLTFLLLFGISFGQKTGAATKNGDTEKKIVKKIDIDDNQISIAVTEDGKTEKYTANMDNDEEIAKLEEKMEELNLDEYFKVYTKIDKDGSSNHEKIEIIKRIDKGDGECEHAEFDEDSFTWHMKDKDEDGHTKIIKMHEPMMSGKKAGYLGVQIQDFFSRSQLSDPGDVH